MRFFRDVESALKYEVATKDTEISQLKLKLQSAEMDLEKKDEKFNRLLEKIESGEEFQLPRGYFNPQYYRAFRTDINEYGSKQELSKLVERVNTLEKAKKNG